MTQAASIVIVSAAARILIGPPADTGVLLLLGRRSARLADDAAGVDVLVASSLTFTPPGPNLGPIFDFSVAGNFAVGMVMGVI